MMIKKIFLRILITFLLFFIIGFANNYIQLSIQYQKSINKEYSSYENENGQDFNEWWLEIHDNFSTKYKTEHSFRGGLFWGVLGTSLSLYIYLLYKLISSKNKIKITIGITLISITLICFFLYYLFIKNFEITF